MVVCNFNQLCFPMWDAAQSDSLEWTQFCVPDWKASVSISICKKESFSIFPDGSFFSFWRRRPINRRWINWITNLDLDFCFDLNHFQLCGGLCLSLMCIFVSSSVFVRVRVYTYLIVLVYKWLCLSVGMGLCVWLSLHYHSHATGVNLLMCIRCQSDLLASFIPKCTCSQLNQQKCNDWFFLHSIVFIQNWQDHFFPYWIVVLLIPRRETHYINILHCIWICLTTFVSTCVKAGMLNVNVQFQ